MLIILHATKTFYVILSYPPLMGLLMMVSFSILGMLIFFGILYILKEVGQEELDVIISAINPKKIKSHISSELKQELHK